MAQFGFLVLVGAFVLDLYAAVSLFLGARRKSWRLVESGRGAVVATTLLTTAASLTLMYLLVTDQFQVAYVAQESSRSMPVIYKLTALWGGDSGSLLFWVWILSLYNGYVVWRSRGEARAFMPYAASIISGISLFFYGLLLTLTPPFQTLSQAIYNGAGMNPLLQNIWMSIHPPMLYAGYVGMSVPFAFAMSSLLLGRTDDTWILLTRRWTLVTWLFLSAGIVLGAHWAYLELGWGGYWAWDPVENASFIPWLTATAFLHSALIQERRGMFKMWNMLLITLTFLLTIFGTFLTRSGIIDSVHAFAGTGLGPYFTAYLVVLTLFAAVVIYRSRGLLQDERRVESLASRESGFLFNNLLLVSATFAIFWGTMYPVLTQFMTGTAISVGIAFFNSVMGPLGTVLVLLMGIAPSLSWGTTSRRVLVREFTLPVVVGVGTAVLLAVLQVRVSGSLIGFGAIAFTLTTVLREFWRSYQVNRQVAGQRGAYGVLTMLGRQRRRMSAYIIHLGVLLLLLGVVGSMGFNRVTTRTLSQGQSMQVGPYTLTDRGLFAQYHGLREDFWATVAISKNGSQIATMHPALVLYPGQSLPVARPDIRSTLAGDLYLVLGSFSSQNQQITLQVFVNPLISFVWVGAIILVLGTFLNLWPSAQEIRRLSDQSAASPLQEGAVARP